MEKLRVPSTIVFTEDKQGQVEAPAFIGPTTAWRYARYAMTSYPAEAILPLSAIRGNSIDVPTKHLGQFDVSMPDLVKEAVNRAMAENSRAIMDVMCHAIMGSARRSARPGGVVGRR